MNNIFDNTADEYWAGIFQEISINFVPLKYIDSVVFNFHNRKIWEIPITNNIKKNGWPAVNHILSDFVSEYDGDITDINYKINMRSVQKDITKITNKFYNKVK